MSETKLDLDAIEARANAATPGPWEYDARRHGVVGPAIDADDLWNGVCGVTLTRGNHGPEKDNAEFIAHARTDVPALVAEVRRLRAAVQKQAENSRANYEEGVREFDQKVAALRRAEKAEADVERVSIARDNLGERWKLTRSRAETAELRVAELEEAGRWIIATSFVGSTTTDARVGTLALESLRSLLAKGGGS